MNIFVKYLMPIIIGEKHERLHINILMLSLLTPVSASNTWSDSSASSILSDPEKQT